MPEIVCVDKQHNVILIDSRDDVGETDLMKSLESVLQIVRDQGLNKVVVDATHQASLPSTVALYYFVSELSKQARDVEHAIVAAGQLPEEMRFIETVGQNRGVNIQLFSSRDEALSWLNRQSHEPNPSIEGTG